nr:YheC/YheD family protein [Acinetobacter sp. Marseille-Q1620]
MIFGILKPNLVITDVEKIFITVSHEKNHDAFVFTAKDIDFDERKIKGLTLKNNKVVEEIFDFPDIVQNRLAIKGADVDAYLKLAEMIPFTSNRIGDKEAVFKKMSTIEPLKKYLIEVIDLKNSEILFESIKKYEKIICKPKASNQGKGIVTINKLKENLFLIKKLDEQFFYNRKELESFYSQELKKEYTISPFLKSETCMHQSTVFRMHITRGENGKWKMIKFFPYVNLNKDIDITNGMLGALITTREKLFLKQYYPKSYKKIEKELVLLFKNFTNSFQKEYMWRLDSIGLDLGITQEGDIYIYEVNVGPGVGFMAYPVACAQVEYYEWLAMNAKKPYLNNFLPINLRSRQGNLV